MSSLTEEGLYTRVHLRVVASLSLGQSLAVLGTTNSFGGSRVENAVRLCTTPDCYPVWYTADPLVVPRGCEVVYRYGIVEAGKVSIFERGASGPEDLKMRKLYTNMLDVLIEDVFEPPVRGLSEEADLNVLPELTYQKKRGLTTEEEFQKSLQTLMRNVKGLHLVCFHLPITVKRVSGAGGKRFEVTWAESLMAKSESSVADSLIVRWFGTLNVPGDPVTESEKKELSDTLAALNCFPIFLSQELHHNFYRGYCKQVLWPTFHNVDPQDHLHAPWNSVLNWADKVSVWRAAMIETVRIFDETIARMVSPGDIVWVHDYHLMLLPKLMRDRDLDVSIVFFLHIPFPTSQVFRSLSDGYILLQSMTCADVVGFHSFDYTRHFLNACKRFLGLRHRSISGGILVIDVGNREVIVSMSHVSIESDMVQRALDDPEVQRMAEMIRAKHQGKKIIASVDVVQRLSGGSLRMNAFEKLLNDNMSLLECPFNASAEEQYVSTKVVLVQKAIQTSARVEDEELSLFELQKMTDAINTKFPGAVDLEAVRGMTLKERLALWRAADVLLITSIRDGLNMMPQEYIFARKDMENAGVVVASEFSLCSTLLNGAIKVNPFNIQNVSDMIDKALNMTVQECSYRRQRDLEFVSTHSSSRWTKEILMDMANARSSAKLHKGLDVSMPTYLDHAIVERAYRAAEGVGITKNCRRLFIFDYGGTLLHSEKYDIYIKQTLSAISGRRPTPTMMSALKVLCDDPDNAVMVVTGLTKMKLGDTFNDFPNLTIVTSNGLVYSWGKNMMVDDEARSLVVGDSPDGVMEGIGTDSHGRTWGCLDFNVDWNGVKAIAVPIITKYTYRTNGTCQTPRIPGIGWSYFGSDPDWGKKQAEQLQVELEAALANYDVKIVSQIQGSIEIVPSALNKGIFAKKFLLRALEKRAGQFPPFCMVVGDEVSDDFMTTAIFKEIGRASPNSAVSEMRAFTVCVGRRATPADSYLSDVKDFEILLNRLAMATASSDISKSVASESRMEIIIDGATVY